MNKQAHYFNTPIHRVVSWFFACIFALIGILNLIYVHVVPFLFYAVLSFIYLPSTNSFLFKKTGFAIPLWTKMLLGLMILWATLAVGDLMEVFEAWMREK